MLVIRRSSGYALNPLELMVVSNTPTDFAREAIQVAKKVKAEILISVGPKVRIKVSPRSNFNFVRFQMAQAIKPLRPKLRRPIELDMPA